MSAKAVTYAEDTLGVHSVHEKALEARITLDGVLTELGEARDRLRDLEFRLSDTEQLIASDEWGKHPDMAATRMEKHLKSALFKSDDWRELREQISKCKGDIEGLEYDKALSEHDIKIASSRMQELGGYLSYLAAVKLSSGSAKSTGEQK